MRSIDVHAHVAPGPAVNLAPGQDWHGFTKMEESGRHFLGLGSQRYWLHPKYLLTPEQRLDRWIPWEWMFMSYPIGLDSITMTFPWK